MIIAKKIIQEIDDLRVNGGDDVDKEAPLEKKTKNKDLLRLLQKMEKDIIRRARRKGKLRRQICE